MQKPPRIAAWLLQHIRLYNSNHSINGDIEELFNEELETRGQTFALLWYWMQTLLTLVQYIKFSIYWSSIMIKNYLIITMRNLLKYKGFSFINIIGLALSMAVCLMIIMYIQDWKSSDKFHENKDRIARIYTTDASDGWDVDGWATTPEYLSTYLEMNYPFIENTTRLRQVWENALNTGTATRIVGFWAEPSFFDIFSYDLKYGDPSTALSEPNTIIISEETALKFFGDEDPLNKILKFETVGDFRVTGVIKKQEIKSHLIFEALYSMASIPILEKSGTFKNLSGEWTSFTRYYTYALLKTSDDLDLLLSALAEVETANIPEEEQEQYGFGLQPIMSINLGLNMSNATLGTKSTIDVFFVPFLAAIVMFLACFNYIILSIARSLKRTKEIGLRKVIGANRSQIVRLFLSETFIITLLALIVACLFILWLVPLFNNIDAIENTQQQINLETMKDPGIYLYFLLLAVVVSIVAGLYPALYLSHLKPVNALQGVSRIKGFSHLLTRKILMGIQFGVSLFAIIFIMYFYQLHTFWLSIDRGIATENFVSLSIKNVNPETLKNEILTNSAVSGVSFSSLIPIYGGGNYTRLKTDNMEEPGQLYTFEVDPDFVDLFEINLVAGRNYSKEIASDIGNSIIINERAVEVFNLGTPTEAIGKVMTRSDSSKVTVIGVVENFVYRKSFENPIASMVFFYHPENFRFLNIRYTPGTKEMMKSYLPTAWKKFDEIHTASFTFFDDEQEEMDSIISGTVLVSAWSCGFIVLIALFGLLGMAAYTSELKTKEIGIRKVMGSSVAQIAYLISKNYLKLILYSAVVAVPSGYFLTDLFLQFFAFRPELWLWVLPASLVFILLLAIITIGSQTVKAALANPVDTLKEN